MQTFRFEFYLVLYSYCCCYFSLFFFFAFLLCLCFFCDSVELPAASRVVRIAEPPDCRPPSFTTDPISDAAAKPQGSSVPLKYTIRTEFTIVSKWNGLQHLRREGGGGGVSSEVARCTRRQWQTACLGRAKAASWLPCATECFVLCLTARQSPLTLPLPLPHWEA